VEKAVDDIKKYVNYLDASMMDEYFKKNDIIVPEARYYKTSITKHYCDCNRKSDYDVLKEVIFEKYPSYMDDFTHVFVIAKAMSLCYPNTSFLTKLSQVLVDWS
jgi:hypothetical protein